MQILLGLIIGIFAMFFWYTHELPMPSPAMSNQTMYQLLSTRMDDLEKCSCKTYQKPD